MAEHVVRYYFKIETIDVYVKLFSDLANMVSEIDVLPFLAITGNMFNAIYEYARLVKLINNHNRIVSRTYSRSVSEREQADGYKVREDQLGIIIRQNVEEFNNMFNKYHGLVHDASRITKLDNIVNKIKILSEQITSIKNSGNRDAMITLFYKYAGNVLYWHYETINKMPFTVIKWFDSFENFENFKKEVEYILSIEKKNINTTT